MTLVKTNPWRELETLSDKMERFFEGFPVFGSNSAYDLAPKFEVYEDREKFYIDAELPGMKKEEVKISLQESVLTIKGEKKFEEEKKNKNYYISERRYGNFTRSIRLPENLKTEEIDAKFDKGVLSLSIPKAEQHVSTEKLIDIK